MREPPERPGGRMENQQEDTSTGPAVVLTNGRAHHKPGKTNGLSPSSSASSPSVNGLASIKKPPDPPKLYLGHNLEEVSRILMQGLVDMGFVRAADALSRESGYEMEPKSVAAFRQAILDGEWDEAELLLAGDDRFRRRSTDSRRNGHSASPRTEGLRLRSGSSLNTMLFHIRQQKFLELLEARNLAAALTVLRTELTPLNQDIGKLHSLSSLLMYESLADLKQQACWDGTKGESRRQLLTELSGSISPSIMLPDRRLATLFQDLKDRQIADCIFHNTSISPTLYSSHTCDGSDFPRSAAAVFTEHENEVWSLAFSPDGRTLASGDAHGKIMLHDTIQLSSQSWLGDHMSGISALSWSPDSRYLVACYQTGHARLWDVPAMRPIVEIDTRHSQNPSEPISSCVWSPDGESFVLGSLTKRTRRYDLQGEILHEWQGRRVNGCDISSDGRFMVTVSRVPTQTINIYNFRTLELEATIPLAHEPSSVSISRDCQSILVNTADHRVLLYSLASRQREAVREYVGHVHHSFDIKGCFGGAEQRFVASGSQDGLVYIWHRNNGQLLETLDGHTDCTNAVAWNPAEPRMLASVGDDRRVVVWTTTALMEEAEHRRQQQQQQHHLTGHEGDGVVGQANGVTQPTDSARSSRGVYV